MDSDDDMELESEIAEMVESENAALASLRARDPKFAVQNADGTLRCPYCSPSKKKQSYFYQDLLQHATAVAVGIRGPEAAGKHSALKLYLESDLLSLATPPVGKNAPQARNYEVLLPRKRAGDSKLVCPWSVIVYKSTNVRHDLGGEQDGQTYVGKNEIKTQFAEFKPDKIHVVWSSSGHNGFSVLHFGLGLEGLNDALALEKHFVDEDHGRRDYERNSAMGNLGQGFYGWLAREGDLNRAPGSEEGAVADYLKASCDLKNIGMVGDEMKKMHGLQVKKLAESLAEKNRESMNLKTELELLQQRAQAGTWTACQIL
ncbi:unnamed protein product [Calypogeia fissa]